MAKPRRVSVQGRGADLFFGDDPTPASTTPPTEAEEPAAVTSEETVEQPPAQPTEQPLEQPVEAMAPARKQASKNGSAPEALISYAILEAIWRDVAEQATVTNSFRYTHDELAQLNDAIYELRKEHGIKITKQDVARLGLNAILTDYQIRGEQSFLSEFVARRKDVGR